MNKRAVTVSGYVIFVSLFLPNEKSIHFPGYTYSECPPRFRPDGERGGGGDCGLEWGEVARSPVITVPSHFPTHW